MNKLNFKLKTSFKIKEVIEVIELIWKQNYMHELSDKIPANYLYIYMDKEVQHTSMKRKLSLV